MFPQKSIGMRNIRGIKYRYTGIYILIYIYWLVYTHSSFYDTVLLLHHKYEIVDVGFFAFLEKKTGFLLSPRMPKRRW